MNLEAIAPIIQKLLVQSLMEPYPYGGARNSVKTGSANKRASGTLINSINSYVVNNGDEQSLVIEMAGYGQFVDEGRLAGSYPPVAAIMQWLLEKGINVRDDRGRFVWNEMTRLHPEIEWGVEARNGATQKLECGDPSM